MTFLLTDVERSTVLWEQAPEAMRRSLARHDTLFDAAVAQHGGTHVRPRGEGDSRFAVFSSAVDAVLASIAIHRSLAAETWPTPDPIKVRIGIHTGEAELRASDYYGSDVNRCARIRGLAYGGQMLVSEATAALVRSSLPAEVTLRDLGEHRLRYLTRPERLFQVMAPSLEADFPPLASLVGRLNNLPAQPTPLIGREREAREIRDLLLDPRVRLVTLTGPGGSGKTRIAVQVASDVADAFEHGVSFVALAPIIDPTLLMPSIAQSLGIREVGSRSLESALEAHLREKQVLLVLDNFEQILQAAPFLAELLGAAGGLKILVTSRAMLHLRGEHEFSVPPLALPEPGRRPLPEELVAYPAIALFAERASAARRGFVLTAENAAAVTESCRRLDGLPLAIELAAARIKLLSPEAMLARLERRLPLLTGGSRDLPARQRTLRDAISWSYDLLDDAERRLFHRVAVFVGGCTVEGAEAVADPVGDLGMDVLDGVASLVDKSLLRQEDLDDERRFRMLETIREFAVERLEASEEADAVRRRHAEYVLSLALAAANNLRGPEQLDWLQLLEREQGNVRAALGWSIGAGAGQLALHLAGALDWLWMLRFPREGREWLDRALALGVSRGLLHTPPGIAALRAQLDLAWAARDPDLANLLKRAAAACTAAGDLRGTAFVEHVRGERTGVFGDPEQAASLLESSVEGFRATGDRWDMARALLDLAHVMDRRGDQERARTILEECVGLFRERGDRWGSTQAHSALAFRTIVDGQYERADRLADASLTLARELNDVRSIAQALTLLGWLAHVRGDGEATQERLQEALALGRDTGNQYAVARVFTVLGERVRARQHYAWAAMLYEQALTLFREIGADEAAGTNLQNLAWAVLRLGETVRAAALFRKSLARPADRQVATGLAGMAGVELAHGRPERAARLLALAAADLERRGATFEFTDRMEYDRTLAEVSSRLEPARLAAAWDDGRSMSAASAISYALEELEVSSGDEA